MKLTLTDLEKKVLKDNGHVAIRRECYIPAPKGSILYGTGGNSLFDKIAYHWVYGDTDKYIDNMKGEGRRGTEYIFGKTGDRNIVNGGCWYEFNKPIDEFGEIGKLIKSGRKNIINYKIETLQVEELKPKGQYLSICLLMHVTNKNIK